jgi:hypothetical protein
MATVKHVKAAILARRASKGRRRKRTRPEPRQYTVADLERAQDRVEAAERRIDKVVGYWKCCGPSAPLGRAGAHDPQRSFHR